MSSLLIGATNIIILFVSFRSLFYVKYLELGLVNFFLKGQDTLGFIGQEEKIEGTA